jgi:hypothetical protein
MNTFQQVVILSAELSTLNKDDNMVRTSRLGNMIQDLGIPFKLAIGSYKGQLENSFVIIVKDNDEIETLKDFAFKNFNQESILHKDANGLASLVFENNQTERLGKLAQVNENSLDKDGSYTFMNGKYYGIIGA